MNGQNWLPPLEYYASYPSWNEYEDALYNIFRADFIENQPKFEEKTVYIRKHPIEYGKEEAFFHVTCQDYMKNHNRVPDLRRCERIRWIRAFIECYHLHDAIKTWSEPYRNTSRVHFLLEEERYMVVLERRNTYCLLITAFYFDHDHALKKKLQHYHQFVSNIL